MRNEHTSLALMTTTCAPHPEIPSTAFVEDANLRRLHRFGKPKKTQMQELS